MDKIEKLESLLQDSNTQEKIFNGSISDVRSNLMSYGLEFSEDEIVDLAKGMIDSQKEGIELNENDLESVSGGSYNNDCYNWGKNIGKAFKLAVKWAFCLFG